MAALYQQQYRGFMKNLLIAIVMLLTCSIAVAGFGGSRSSFSSSSSRSSFSSSRSSFGGSRSSGPATISRPAPSYSRPTTVINHTTVVRRGYGGSGFVTGMVVGSALSRPRQVVVVGQPQPVYVDQQGQQIIQQPVVVNNETHWFLTAISIIAVVIILYAVLL